MVVLRAVEAQAEEQAEVTKVINLTPIPKQIQERLKKIVDGLQRVGWKLEDKKGSKNG